MKILALRLNNLASLAGEHAIHFDQSPLAHAGLIAITGKTGAGKSTLLDAMCLALYDEVPRLRGAAGSIKDAGGKDISIKDSKNILRRGTTSGFAELEFIALDGKRYITRWDISRARKKVDGNLKVERFVKCLDDDITLTQKISEVTPCVEKLIGLSFEQFTRAVLLAQSEVGAFLKAKDHERADLLEYLTNSHIFSLVSQKAAQKYSEVRHQRAELEQLMGHVDILSTEALADLQQQQHALRLELQHLQQAEKLLENEKKWHLDRHKLYAEMHGKKEIYDVQLDAVTKSLQQQQLLEQLDAFQSVRDAFVQQRQLFTQQQQLKTQHSEFSKHVEQLQQGYLVAQTQLDQHIQQQLQQQQHLLNIKPHLEQGLKLDHDIQTIADQFKECSKQLEQLQQTRLQPLAQQHLQAETDLNRTIAEQQQVIQQLQNTQHLHVFDEEPQAAIERMDDYLNLYAQYSQSSTQFQQPLNALEQQKQQLRTTLDSLTARYGELHQLEAQQLELRHHLHDAGQQRLQLDHLAQRLQTLASQQQRSENVQHAQQQLHTEHQQQLQLDQQLNTQLHDQQQQFDQLEQILQQQRLLHSHSVQELRSQLKENEACMVCGSHQHPFVEHADLLTQRLDNLQDSQRLEAKKALDELKQQQQQSAILLSKQATLLEQQRNQIQELQQQSTELKDEIWHALMGFEIVLTAQDELVTAQHQLQQRQQRLDQQQGLNEQRIQELQHDLQLWRTYQQQIQDLDLVLKQHQQLAHMLTTIVQRLPEHHRDLELHHPESLRLFKQQLQTRIEQLRHYQHIEQRKNAQHQQVEKIQVEFALEQKQCAQLEHQLSVSVQQGKDSRQQLAVLTEQYAGRVYRVAADWRQALEQHSRQLEQQLDAQRQKTHVLERDLHQANLKQHSLMSQLQHIEQQLELCTTQMQTWQQAHPDISPQMIEHYLSIDLAQHQRLRQDLANQQQALATAETAWQLLEQQYQQHLTQQPEHDDEQLDILLAQWHTEKQALQDSYNELEAKLRLNRNNQITHAKYQTQIEQMNAEEYRWGRIYDLIGHKEGTKFQKIAQEHHLDILVEYANQQLQPLAPRYQLHRIPDSLSLAIIDLDMNSEIRPVLSLSGGETFLVSLALALAIANMASGSMKLESLFIDEGFGTLDPASLHMVMNALDHLQSQGRKVVLISHIQDMHERIPVQIQVKPVGAGASRLEIVG